MLGQEERAHPLVKGVVVRAPASLTDKVDVRIPSFGPHLWARLPWTTRGSLLPAVGASCLVAFDEDGLTWVVCWDW